MHWSHGRPEFAILQGDKPSWAGGQKRGVIDLMH
jgi:hypothetical protein